MCDSRRTNCCPLLRQLYIGDAWGSDKHINVCSWELVVLYITSISNVKFDSIRPQHLQQFGSLWWMNSISDENTTFCRVERVCINCNLCCNMNITFCVDNYVLYGQILPTCKAKNNADVWCKLCSFGILHDCRICRERIKLPYVDAVDFSGLPVGEGIVGLNCHMWMLWISRFFL